VGDVELRLPADAAYVGLARLVVVAAARSAGMDDARIEDLRIAVSEAASNAVLAHQRSGQGEPVVVHFGAAEHDMFEVTVADAGLGADAELSADGASGDAELGVTLIRGLADDVSFSLREGTSLMTFAVRLAAAGDVDDEPVLLPAESVRGAASAR